MRVSEALARASGSRPRLIPLELPTQSNPGRHTADGSVRLINCYAEQIGKEGKFPLPIYACDGLESFATLTGGGACRGLFSTETHCYVVSGRLLFAVDYGGGVTTIGGIPDDNVVIFSRNRATPSEIVITTTGGFKYIVTNSGSTFTLTEISDSDLPPPYSNAFINGYTLYFIHDGRVFYSALDDASNIDALDFFEAEGSPDRLIRGFVHQNTIFLLSTETTEIWFNDPTDTNNPFHRAPGGFLQFGCLASGSVVSLRENIAFVDNHGQVRIANSAGSTQRISTHAVERSIDALSDNDKAAIEGFVYERRGHVFYVLSGSSFTWIYDLTTGMWHERQSDGENRWRAAYYTKFKEKHVVGDFESGLLYTLDPDAYDEAGGHLTMTVQFPIHAWPNAIALNRLRFDMIPGVGLNSSDEHVADPQLMLSVSRNGGKSFESERTRSIGEIGEYTAMTIFDKCGSSTEDGFVVKMSASAAVVRGCTGVSGEIRVQRR
jgi:hypothetical protein